MREINELIWHCTATPEGRHVTVEEIDAWHKARGWSGIGYHWVVYLDGTVHAGRPERKKGAHVAGHNSRTIGCSYVGGVTASLSPKDTRTPEQRDAMVKLTRAKIAEFDIKKVTGHRIYANKACPSFDATSEYAPLLDETPPPIPTPPTNTITLADHPVEAFQWPSHATFVRAFEGGSELVLREKNSSGMFDNPIGGVARWYCVVVNEQQMWIQDHDVI